AGSDAGAGGSGGSAPAGSRTTAASSGATYGVGATVQVSVAAPATASGTVAIAAGAQPLASGRVSDGAATVKLHGTALRPGRHRLTVRFSGSDSVAASSTTVVVPVRRAAPALKATRVTKRVEAGRTRARLRIAVTAPGLNPGGTVRVTEAGRTVGSAKVRGGRARVKLDRFETAGTKRLRITYGGDGPLVGRTVVLPLKVR
ncbi:Ig-like domain-containing protein, partial [Conexibacter stalactiti]